MRSTFAPLLVLASFLAVVVAQTPLEIFTPQPPPVQCQPTLLTWIGGTPPYIVSVLDQTVDPTTPVISFQGLTNTSITWEATTPGGDMVLFTIKDSTGLSENSAPVAVGQGTTSCLNTSSSSASGSKTTSGSSTGSKSASASPSKTSSSTAVLSTPPTTAPSTTPSATKPVTSLPATSGSASGSGSNSGSASVSAPSTAPSGAAAHKGVPAAAAAAALGAVFAALL